MIGEILLPSLTFTPLVLFACAVAMVVLRAGASRIFFDIVGTFQATKLLKDAQATATVLEALYIDSFMGITESAEEISEMFNELTEATLPLAVEIENARVELEKFLDAGDDIDQISDELETIGLRFGFAADEAFAAGARMAQLSGVLGGGATPVGTELGVMFGLISGMETEAAMQRLINLNQQTKFMTKNVTENMTAQERANQIRTDSIRILDQLNTVENRSAATMQQITFVMNQFASQAHLTGESIASMAAMSATLIEAGEEQGKGGRALRMIYARLGADTNGARSELEKLGIEVFNAEGTMRPFSELLKQIAGNYQEMSDKEKMAFVQTVAGNRHYTRLIKLIENVDRVRELELEALIAQFPARGELQRRLESEVFLYEQAEARLKNYSAAFGEQLLPVMTKATNRQADFFKQLNAFAEGPLGPVLTGFVFLSKTMSSFVGPTFQAILGIKGLTIALETQQIVQRALNGEQIANLQLNKAQNLQVGLMMQRKHEQVMVIEKENMVTSVAAEKLREEIRERIQLINQLDRSSESRAAHERWLNRDIEALRALGVEIDIVGAKTDRGTLSNKENTNSILGNSMALTSYSMKLGAAGSLLMMFGKNEKSMRYGMMLTTTAMALQMAQTIRSMNATMKDTGAKTLNLISQEAVTAAVKKHVTALAGATAGTKAATVATNMLNTSFKRMLVTTGVGIVALGVLHTLSKSLFPSFNDAAEGIEAYNSAIADTGLVVEYLKLSDAEAVALLKEKKEAYDAVKDSTTQVGQETANRLATEIASLQKTVDLNTISNMQQEDAQEIASEYYDLLEKQNQVIKESETSWGKALVAVSYYKNTITEAWTEIPYIGDAIDEVTKKMEKIPIIGDMMTHGSILGPFAKKQEDDYIEATEAIDEFVASHVELGEWLEQHKDLTEDEFGIALQEYIKTLNEATNAEDEYFNSFGSGIDESLEKIYSFNNAREELFFGFSSDRLTGDLVRQVRQQGVETLITSTEVIMTNNFNGMTTAEVASEILRLIETEGNFKDYNFATTAG